MIIRTDRRHSFTVISNALINDPALDWKDLGLLVYLLSKPDTWHVSVTHLAAQRKSGRGCLYSILKRLRAAGYADYSKNADGTTDWVIRDYSAETGPEREFPHIEKPHVEKRTQVNTETTVNTETAVNTDSATQDVAGASPTQEKVFQEEQQEKPRNTQREGEESETEADKKTIWRLGVEILVSSGMREGPARSFLGKMAGEDETRLAKVIGVLSLHPKADPVAYIRRAMLGNGRITTVAQAEELAERLGLPPARVGESLESFILRVTRARDNGAQNHE